MKLVPPLPPLPTGATMERLPLPLPFSPDLWWRCQLPFSATAQPQGQAPASPLMDFKTHLAAAASSSPVIDFKTHLPTALAADPRLWSRDDVIAFLKWAEREFDLQPFDTDMFQMNGKALCLLTRTDLSERSPGSGDVLHNVLQLLIRDANLLQRCLPSSPVTPTSQHAYPLSPHSHPSTPKWNLLSQNGDSFHPSHAAIAAHFMAQSNSVTLSPAPSVDSQAGSPQHAAAAAQPPYAHSVFGSAHSNGSGSNGSDSDEDSYQVGSPPNVKQSGSPPSTPAAHTTAAPQQPSSQPQTPLPRSPKEIPPQVGGAFQPVAREFFPAESPEPNTNGRLLWDFLQQLLNDPTQRYTNFIAWKNRDTGVFKIVDPAGLAKLWGIQKNHLSMNYDKMSRALRYYYRVNILRKVQGERHCYQFLRNPTELKNIKNISLLRQQMSPTRLTAATPMQQQGSTSITIKSEPGMEVIEHVVPGGEPDDDDKPTDLRMVTQPADLSVVVPTNGDRKPAELRLCEPSALAHAQPTDLSHGTRHPLVKSTLSDASSDAVHYMQSIKADTDTDSK